jgi:cholesterol transport system auxiliary component
MIVVRGSSMRIAAAVLASSLPLLAGGCVSALHSNQPAQQQYVLTLPAPATGAAASAGAEAGAGAGASRVGAATLQVLAPAAGAGLGTENIAVMRPGQRLDYYSGARWAATAPAMLQALVIQAVRRQGRFALVEAEGGPFDARYVLSLELTHFEADYAGGGPPTVRVALVCTLGQRAARSVVSSFTVNGTAAANADRMQAVVAAFQRATDEALMQMTGRLAPPALPGRG